jgi:hypothetical protein
MRVHAWASWQPARRALAPPIQAFGGVPATVTRNSELNAVQSGSIITVQCLIIDCVRNEYKKWLLSLRRLGAFPSTVNRHTLFFCHSQKEGPNHFFKFQPVNSSLSQLLPSCNSESEPLRPHLSGATKQEISFSPDFWKLIFQTDLERNPTCKPPDITCRARQRGVRVVQTMPGIRAHSGEKRLSCSFKQVNPSGTG